MPKKKFAERVPWHSLLWEGRYSPKWIDGKKHARNIYAHTREEKLAALIVQMKRELAELKAAQAAGAPFRH